METRFFVARKDSVEGDAEADPQDQAAPFVARVLLFDLPGGLALGHGVCDQRGGLRQNTG